MQKQSKNIRINSTINEKLEKEFREITFNKFGFKKGSIQDGLEEALDEWVKKQRKKK